MPWQQLKRRQKIFNQIQEKIDDNDLRIGSFILALEQCIRDVHRSAEEARQAAIEPEVQPTTETSRQSSNLKLPKISLPTFSGNYREWVPFIDLFRSTVDYK